MADSKKAPQLDKGFEEIPLDKGFEEVPMSDEDQAMVSTYISKPEGPGMIESTGAGLASGGTFGFAPRIGAALGAGIEEAHGNPSKKSLKDLYNEYLEFNNRHQKNAAEAHPVMYGAGQFAGAFASPMNKLGAAGELAANASLPTKMVHGAVAGGQLGAIAGLSQSPDLANIPKDIASTGEGATFGAAMGAGMVPIMAGLRGAASGAGNMIRPLVGKPGEMFNKGVQAGQEGAPNLAGEPGQLAAVRSRGQFADQFVNDLHDVLSSNAKNKRELISQALQKSQLAPKEAVEAVMQKYLQANPQLNEESARKELAHLKDMIITAAEGPETTQTVRQYKPSEMEPDTGATLEKHKKIMSREIDPEAYVDVDAETANHEDVLEPKTEADRFASDVEKKKAELRALTGHGIDPDSIEIHHEPIEGSNKVMAVARAPIYSENPEAFKGAAEVPFQDVQQTVREGGRNLQNPEELYALQKNLQAKSQFSEGRGFSSQEMNKMSGDAAKDIASLIKMSVPETVPVDERLNAFNNVAERLGLDTDKLKIPGGEGQKARADAMNKILGLLKAQSGTDKGTLNENAIDYVKQQLNRVHPDIGNAFEEEAGKHATTAQTINDINNPKTIGGDNPFVRVMRRGASKAAYGTGHWIGDQGNKMKEELAPAKQLFQNYTPEALQNAAAGASQSANASVQKLGEVLSKLATADDRTRNSMMFVLEQQPGYRQLMAPYFEKQEKGTPQAKDKTLEKYK